MKFSDQNSSIFGYLFSPFIRFSFWTLEFWIFFLINIIWIELILNKNFVRIVYIFPRLKSTGFFQSWSHIFTRTSNAAGGNTAWLVIPRPVPALAWHRTSLSAWATIPCVSFWNNYRPRSTVPACMHANFSPKRPWRPVRKKTWSPQSRHSCPAVSQSASTARCRCIVSPWSSKVFSLVLFNPLLSLTVSLLLFSNLKKNNFRIFNGRY